jgi:hypothetical protein
MVNIKKHFLRLSLASAILLTFIGCESNTGLSTPTTSTTPTTQITIVESSSEIDKDFITKNLTVGTNQDNVEKWFGAKYAIVFNGETDKKEWRYDIADNDYEFAPSNGLGDTAHADLEGLKEGKVKMHLFIGWTDDNKVESYTLYYNAGDKKNKMLHLQKDGNLQELDN